MAELFIQGSSSRGNQYVIKTSTGCLAIECGWRFSDVRKCIRYKTGDIVGCLVSHVHSDHAHFCDDFSGRGFPILSNPEVMQKYPCVSLIEPMKWRKIGDFLVLPFEVPHDALNYGYLIRHADFGTILFATDTYAIPYHFKQNIDWYLIEANYSDEILAKSDVDSAQKRRLMVSHMSLDYCLQYLAEENLTETSGIVLIHLSDRHSNEEQFRKAVQTATGRLTYIADKHIVIDISKNLE